MCFCEHACCVVLRREEIVAIKKCVELLMCVCACMCVGVCFNAFFVTIHLACD